VRSKSPFNQAEIKGVMPLTKDVAETYLKFQSIIGHCITNGEDINNQLRELLLDIKEINCPKEDILKKDFMALRDVFSDFLEKYADIHNESNFNSKNQRKGMTKLMFSFITDRNIYTHGVLRIQRPEEVFVIDYIENKKEKARVEVTLQCLESFLQLSDLIKSLLNEIGTFYRKVKSKG
jgi:phosphatidate phosphatase PAH1